MYLLGRVHKVWGEGHLKCFCVFIYKIGIHIEYTLSSKWITFWWQNTHFEALEYTLSCWHVGNPVMAITCMEFNWYNGYQTLFFNMQPRKCITDMLITWKYRMLLVISQVLTSCMGIMVLTCDMHVLTSA